VQGLGPPSALVPFLPAGLLTHYWLDGRIWTRLAPSLTVSRWCRLAFQVWPQGVEASP